MLWDKKPIIPRLGFIFIYKKFIRTCWTPVYKHLKADIFMIIGLKDTGNNDTEVEYLYISYV